MYDYSTNLNPEKALIWRIVHRDNLPWILDNGLHCGNSAIKSPVWVHIGNSELISKRASHAVPLAPFGVLNDYVPFYFTPFSPMMMNIVNGRGGVIQRRREELIILATSLKTIQRLDLPFVFTNSHAYYTWANFYNNLTDLKQIDWKIIQSRDFKRDSEDPAKIERYQAEALIHNHCPVSALAGIVCYNDNVKETMIKHIKHRGLGLPVYARPKWYL